MDPSLSASRRTNVLDRSATVVLLVAVFGSALAAQETTRELDHPGEHSKHLTRDTVDRWKLQAQAGEVLRVTASSAEFDPVLELVTADDDVGDVVVAAVDDPGSESHFLHRIEAAGRYAILVHGPERRGGGNYRLYVERFTARPLGDDRTLQAAFDRDGVDHVRFSAAAGEIVVPVGASVAEVIDPKGLAIASWNGSYTIEKTGEHHLTLRGGRQQPYSLQVLTARQRRLEAAAVVAGIDREDELPGFGMDTWDFEGEEGELRQLELWQRWPCALRVVPLHDDDSDRLDGRPALQTIPVLSKGRWQRQAFVLQRSGRYRIEIRSPSSQPNGYRLRFGDPTQRVELDSDVDGQLSIGGSGFYAFEAQPGQLVQVGVDSPAFDPMISVERADGSDLLFDDDGGEDLACRGTFLVTDAGLYRVHVASYGNGGGGRYTLHVRDVAIPELAIGASTTATAPGAGDAHWHFTGRKDQTLFVSVRSDAIDVAVHLYDPSGIALGGDDDSGVDSDALAAVRLPRDGRYTVVVTAKSGGGSYRLSLIDADQGG